MCLVHCSLLTTLVDDNHVPMLNKEIELLLKKPSAPNKLQFILHE